MKSFPFLLAIALLQYGCSRTAPKPKADTQFLLSDTLRKLISIDTVRLQPVTQELRLTGKVSYDPNRVINVFPLVGGNVEKVNVELGAYVQKGAVLAVIHSGEIAEYEQQLADAEADMAVAHKNLSVAEDLFAAKLTSQRDLIIAREEYQKADAKIDKIKQLLGIYSAGGNANYFVYAPATGFIVDKNILPGMQIRPDNGTTLFTISSLQEVWVIMNIYETDIPHISIGMPTEITTLSYGDKKFYGQVDQIFSAIDPESRTLKARIRLSNADMQLKPDMFASVKVLYKEGKSLPAITASSVVFDNNRYYVVVLDAQNIPSVREVVVEATAGGQSFISSGVKPLERVISNNALLVYNAL